MLAGVVSRRSEESFSVGLGLGFYTAGGCSLLDRNGCPRGQGMLYADLSPWTSLFTNATYYGK